MLTLSREESSVKLTRLVVESANAVLAEPAFQSSIADESNDGSVLVDFPNVKVALSVFFIKSSPYTGLVVRTGIHAPIDSPTLSGELTCG